MKGDDINLVPAKKREEWLKQKKERERQLKIDRAIQKEVDRLNIAMQAKMAEQDEHFLEAVQNIKNPKKK